MKNFDYNIKLFSRVSIIETIKAEMAAKKGATAFNKQIGKVKRDGRIAEQPKYSKLERMKSNNVDPEPQDHVSHKL